MLHVSYMREENCHDLYRVRCLGQTIIVSLNVMVAKIGMDQRCLIGYNMITFEQAEAIGFVIPVGSYESNEIAV